MGSSVRGPGILYVNSKITSTDLSPELFTQWYEDVHIPDIFKTSGIKSAFRYYTHSPDPEAVERPYLAVYPLKEVSFLQTPEFKSIPVHSDMLPIESKAIFDLADFDTRYYTNISKIEADGANGGEPGNLLASVQFDVPAELKVSSGKGVEDWYKSKHSFHSSTRVRIYKNYFARQNRLPQEHKQLAEPLAFLALHEFDSEDDLKGFQSAMESITLVSTFKLLKAFGDINHNF